MMVLIRSVAETACVCQVRQDKTRQDKTRQDKTRQDKKRRDETRQDKTRQDETGQDETRRDKARRDETRQDKTRQNKIIPVQHSQTSWSSSFTEGSISHIFFYRWPNIPHGGSAIGEPICHTGESAIGEHKSHKGEISNRGTNIPHGGDRQIQPNS